MRRMYDSIDAAKVPQDGDLYLGYDDGNWPDADELARRFPGKLVLRTTVFPDDNEGDVGDCETGDMTVGGLVNWIGKRRLQGHPNPLGYFSWSLLPNVRSAFQAMGVREPPYIVALYDHDPTLPPSWVAQGIVGKQFESTTDYDISTVVAYIPGIDAVTPDQIADHVRALIIDYWGREPSTAEQAFCEQFYITNGADLTRASIYDHANGAAFRAKRGW